MPRSKFDLSLGGLGSSSKISRIDFQIDCELQRIRFGLQAIESETCKILSSHFAVTPRLVEGFHIIGDAD